MTSVEVYRQMVKVIEDRREECNLSMETVNDLAGLNDGYYAKMINPDSPSGRQAHWTTVQLAIEALFGRNFTLQILPDVAENRRLASAPTRNENASSNARNIRHWRHRRHFEELGRKGGEARAKLGLAKLSAAARKGWKKRKAAQRAGQAHRAANAEKAT